MQPCMELLDDRISGWIPDFWVKKEKQKSNILADEESDFLLAFLHENLNIVVKLVCNRFDTFLKMN